MKPRPGDRKGLTSAYTLVEVVVAVMVLAIIGLAYYAALSSGFALVQSTRDDLRATQVMAQKIEMIRLCTWRQLTNFNFQEAFDPLAVNNKSKGTIFYGSVKVGPATGLTYNPSYYPNIRQVTVSLSWTNYNGKYPVAHSRQMQTETARYGLQNYVWGAL